MSQKGLCNEKRTFLLYLLCTLTSARGWGWGGCGREGSGSRGLSLWWSKWVGSTQKWYLFHGWISQVVVYEREGKSVI